MGGSCCTCSTRPIAARPTTNTSLHRVVSTPKLRVCVQEGILSESEWRGGGEERLVAEAGGGASGGVRRWGCRHRVERRISAGRCEGLRLVFPRLSGSDGGGGTPVTFGCRRLGGTNGGLAARRGGEAAVALPRPRVARRRRAGPEWWVAEGGGGEA
jgi:hypothetical protein